MHRSMVFFFSSQKKKPKAADSFFKPTHSNCSRRGNIIFSKLLFSPPLPLVTFHYFHVVEQIKEKWSRRAVRGQPSLVRPIEVRRWASTKKTPVSHYNHLLPSPRVRAHTPSSSFDSHLICIGSNIMQRNPHESTGWLPPQRTPSVRQHTKKLTSTAFTCFNCASCFIFFFFF